MRLIPTESDLFKILDITLKILDITLDVLKTSDIREFLKILDITLKILDITLKILDITLNKTKHIARTMPKNT